MTVLSVPPDDGITWPSLGGLVVAWIEDHLVFGPGDLRGEPAKVDPEKRAFIWRMYEVFPEGAQDANHKLIQGRRRFRRCCLSLQKGTAKTEFAAWLAAVELHPDGPVRCSRFVKGRPVGHGVTDPYIPLVAYTEEQTEDLAYGALKAILENSRVAKDFDIGLERIMRRAGDGKAVALASSPNARDGARTTFAHKDETHRWTLPALKRAHQTMLANLPKRLLADPWELETTTAYSPGEGSVAEATWEYAKQVHEGKIQDSKLFFFHRQASDEHDMTTPEGLRAAVIEACGPTVAWRDISGIVDQFQDPEADIPYLERVWLNRPKQASAQAFDAAAWREHALPGAETELAGEMITLGFDGSLNEDSTALVATHVATGLQWAIGLWEKPQVNGEGWEVDKEAVDAVVNEAFATYDVWRMYADPSKWESQLAAWAGRHGEKKVIAWPTTLYRRMGVALKAYAGAIHAGEVLNNGDPAFAAHIGNACRNTLTFRDDDDTPLWLIQKDRAGSPNKIDAAMAGCLSWAARTDAVRSGALEEDTSVLFVYRPEKKGDRGNSETA